MKEQHPGLPRQRKRVAFITDAPSVTSFTQRILSGIALFIQKRRSVVLQQVPFTEIANDTLNGRFDGIISNLCATHTRDLLVMLNGASLPIVDTGAEIKDPSLIRVDIDIVREGTVAAEWFLLRGFRNFAYCGFHGVGTYPFNDILESAFAAAVEKAGHQCLMFNMPPVTNKSKRYLHILQLALDKWGATLPPRTAVFCVHQRQLKPRRTGVCRYAHTGERHRQSRCAQAAAHVPRPAARDRRARINRRLSRRSAVSREGASDP